jgi:hypothetical protein
MADHECADALRVLHDGGRIDGGESDRLQHVRGLRAHLVRAFIAPFGRRAAVPRSVVAPYSIGDFAHAVLFASNRTLGSCWGKAGGFGRVRGMTR